MAKYPTSAATDADLYVAKNNLSTGLSAELDSSTVTILVYSTTGFPTSGYITVDQEAIKYTGLTGTSFTGCTRGADGTTASAHALGSKVSHNIVADHHNALKNEIEAIESDLVAKNAAVHTISLLDGVVGDGVTDDTTALQAVINSYTIIVWPVINSGAHLISAPLALSSGHRLSISPSVTLKAKNINWLDQGMFLISEKADVYVEGGCLDGDKANNPTGDIFGFMIKGNSARVTIKDMHIQGMPGTDSAGTNGGDGIYIGETGKVPQDISITDVTIDNCTRQAVSVVSGKRLRFVNSSFINTTGTNGGFGLDLEPNDGAQTLDDVIVTACNFDGNKGGSIAVSSYCSNVVVDGNAIRGHATGVGTEVAISGNNITVTNNVIDHPGNLHALAVSSADGVTVHGNIVIGDTNNASQGDGIHLFEIHNVSIIGNTLKNTYDSGLWLDQNEGNTFSSNLVVVGNTFVDCVNGAAGSRGALQLSDNGNPGRELRYATVCNNLILDSRAGASRAPYGLLVQTTPAYTAQYTVFGNIVTNTQNDYYGLNQDQLGSARGIVVGGTSTFKAAAGQATTLSLDTTDSNQSTSLTFKRAGTSKWSLYAPTDDSGLYFSGLTGYIARLQTTGRLSVGSDVIDNSAAFQVNSTTGGVLIPKLTTTQRDAVSSPAEGLMIYNTTLHKFQLRTASTWETVTSS